MRNVFVTVGLVDRGKALPIFVGWRAKWPAGLLICFLAAALYILSNHLALRDAQTLPLLEQDRAIPFWPATVWIYLSGLIYLPVIYRLNRCIVSLNKHLYSFFALICISTVIFVIFPTTYPRELYPVPSGVDALTLKAFALLRWMDTPRNCAPSLHVSIAFLIAFGFLEDQKAKFPWIVLWAFLLALSTLTTKQHYLIDVLSGVALAGLCFIVFHRILPYRFTLAVKRELSEEFDVLTNPKVKE